MKIKLSTNNTPTTEHVRSPLNHKNYNSNMNKMNNNPEIHQQMMSQQMMNQQMMNQQMMNEHMNQMSNQQVSNQQVSNQQVSNQQTSNQQTSNQQTSNQHSNQQTPLQTDLPERQSPTTPTGHSIDLSSNLPSPPKIMVSDLHLQPGQAPLASPRAVRAFSLTPDINYQNNIQQQKNNNSQHHQNIPHHQQAIQTNQLKQQTRPASAVQSSSSSDSDSSSEDEEDEKLKQKRLQSKRLIACAELSEIAKQERSYRGFKNIKVEFNG